AHDLLRRVARYEPAKDAPRVFVAAKADATALVDVIAGRIPSVTIRLKDKQLPGLAVTLDDRPVDLVVVGFPTPVNPGSHAIAATATGYLPAKTSVTVA